MIIISDASPIIALHNIGQLALLKEVYREISITDIVCREVEISLPEWIKVVNEYNMALYESLTLHLVNELTTKGFRLSDSLLTIVRKKLSE